MAVMAGLLGVRLEKPGAYVLGDPRVPLTPAMVHQAWRVVTMAAVLMIGLCALLIFGMHRLWSWV